MEIVLMLLAIPLMMVGGFALDGASGKDSAEAGDEDEEPAPGEREPII